MINWCTSVLCFTLGSSIIQFILQIMKLSSSKFSEMFQLASDQKWESNPHLPTASKHMYSYFAEAISFIFQ